MDCVVGYSCHVQKRHWLFLSRIWKSIVHQYNSWRSLVLVSLGKFGKVYHSVLYRCSCLARNLAFRSGPKESKVVVADWVKSDSQVIVSFSVIKFLLQTSVLFSLYRYFPEISKFSIVWATSFCKLFSVNSFTCVRGFLQQLKCYEWHGCWYVAMIIGIASTFKLHLRLYCKYQLHLY